MQNQVCSETPYLCVEVLKDPTSKPKFKLDAEPEDATIACAPLPCNGVIITDNSISVPSDAKLKENSPINPIILDIDYGTDDEGSSIFGEDLWKLSVHGNNKPDGSGDSIPLGDQVLTDVQPDQPLAGGKPLSFSPVSTNLDLTGIKCEEIPFVCLTLSKGDKPSREFTLTGKPDDGVMTACAPVPCTKPKVQITDSSVDPTDPIIEDSPENPVSFDAVFKTDPNADPVLPGTDLWNLDTWVSEAPKGDGPRISENRDVLTPEQKDLAADAGDELIFRDIEAKFNLTGKDCEKQKYICAELSKSPACTADFELAGVPDDSKLRTCGEIDCIEGDSQVCLFEGKVYVEGDTWSKNECEDCECKGSKTICVSLTCPFLTCPDKYKPKGECCTKCTPRVVITNTEIDLAPDTKTIEGLYKNKVNFDVTALYDDTTTSIIGTKLWRLNAWHSKSPNGKGEQLSYIRNVLIPEQVNTPVTIGLPITFLDVMHTINMQNQVCSETPYLCVEILKNPKSKPKFKLDAEPEDATIACAPLPCNDGSFNNSDDTVMPVTTLSYPNITPIKPAEENTEECMLPVIITASCVPIAIITVIVVVCVRSSRKKKRTVTDDAPIEYEEIEITKQDKESPIYNVIE
ncbi:uncharacterized protein LOC144442123 [Glandiceps talaboti]